jgi:hypothetical protein
MIQREIQTTTDVDLTDTLAARTATFTGATIDTFGCNAIDVFFLTGTVTTADASNYFALGLQEGDASDASDMAACALADLIIDGVPAPSALPRINATSAKSDKVVTRISYRGTKRYIRIVGTETGTASAVIGAGTLRGHLVSSPA